MLAYFLFPLIALGLIGYAIDDDDDPIIVDPPAPDPSNGTTGIKRAPVLSKMGIAASSVAVPSI